MFFLSSLKMLRPEWCTLLHKQVKTWHAHAMEYCLQLKKEPSNAICRYTGGSELPSITSQKEKDKVSMITYM